MSKSECTFNNFLAYNFEIHKTFDSNKIELHDTKKYFFKFFLKSFFLNNFLYKKRFFLQQIQAIEGQSI